METSCERNLGQSFVLLGLRQSEGLAPQRATRRARPAPTSVGAASLLGAAPAARPPSTAVRAGDTPRPREEPVDGTRATERYATDRSTYPPR